MRNKVFGLVYKNENDALRFGSFEYCYALNREGYVAQVLDLQEEESIKQLADSLASEEVAFCFGLQGIGSRLTTLQDTNLWAATQVPFICLHYDHPCHNPYNHFSDSPFVGNIYHFESFLDAKKRYLPSNQLNKIRPFTFVESPSLPQLLFKDRPIRLLFVKSGQSLEDTAAELSNLPKELREGILTQLKQAEGSPNLDLCALVEEVFVSINVDYRRFQQQFWSAVKLMDRALRRMRAIEMVNWLKLQEGALIIGDGWDFIDKTNAKALFKPTMNLGDTLALYGQTQFLCNVNPYGRDIIHERVVCGLVYNCCVLTDSNAWWDQNFSDVPSLIRFDWNRSLEVQLRPVLENVKSVSEISLGGRPAASERFAPLDIDRFLQNFAESISEYAKTTVGIS